MPCPACGGNQANPVAHGTDRLYHTTDDTFGVLRCADCGLLRLHPRPAANELSRYYPEGYWFDPGENKASRMAEAYRRLVLRDHVGFVSSVFRNAGASGPMLDVGCGGGLLAGMLRERGIAAMGLDRSRAACRIAWEQHRVPVVAADLEAPPFPLALFRVISLFHVLEHLPDPQAYLERAHCLLGPEGRLVVQVPNADSWQFRLLGKRWNGLDIPRHFQNFRTKDLRAMLESSGFEVVRVKHFSWRDNPAGLATSLAPGLDPMARRIRGKRSGMAHHLMYFGLVLLSIPFAALEAAFAHGSSVMMEARKR